MEESTVVMAPASNLPSNDIPRRYHSPSASASPRIAGFLALFYSVLLLPILRADRLYNDDLKRALFGHTSWDSNGRPLTTLLMKLLQCYDHALVDISPF